MLNDLLDENLRTARTLAWEGSFADYLGLVTEQPHLAARAHQRVYRMLMAAGVDKDEQGRLLRYRFFAGEIFGIPEVQEAIVDYFRAAAQGMEVRKRVLLLMGPPAGGKSSIVTLLKRRLAEWTRTEEGAVYAVKGCPLNEDPLHLLPESAREKLRAVYGVAVEGDPCPVCRYRLEHEWEGDPRNARVVRVSFSEAARVGIGTFTPSDPKSQDISELIGSMNLATVGTYGDESHPYAYRFNGELHVANRGLMEFVELLKADHRFLYVLLTLAQEQVIKAPRYPLLYCDEVVLSHTNEAEFQRFLADKTNEALQDRMHVIRVPYNLRVTEEERIYAKLVAQGNVNRVHVAPLTLRVAAMFGVMSRLDEKAAGNLRLVDKMKLYNGERLEGWTDHQVKELREKSPREGMEGLGPRFLIDGLGKAMGRPDVTCINPLDAVRGLLDHLDRHPTVNQESKERYKSLLAQVRKEYDRLITKEVSRVFVHAFEDQARGLVERYLTEVMAWKQKDKLTDPVTGDPRDADEKFLRAVEEQIGVAEHAKKEFREEILTRVAYLATRGQRFDYGSHARLREAVEGKIFADVRGVMKTITRIQSPDEGQRKKLEAVIGQLTAEGYCEHCAREVLRYLGSIIDA